MQVLQQARDLKTELYLKRPIKRDVTLRLDQNLLLENEARKFGVSISKLISIIIDMYFGIELWTWYSSPNLSKYVQRCESCPSFVRGEFSNQRFFILCRNNNCKESWLLKRQNDFISVPRIGVQDVKV
jgi:hypothetical protein